ncbi:hypothetical protein WMY93_024182 [Mugilogobius chulae]|uniref:Uncharacterized protein n=1 Tax=Mugilogobius chulae TaxID=88201 RepID=A0AAW0N901_9GOBI
MRRFSWKKELSREENIRVYTFVTCVALYQRGVYVDYRALSKLECQLPLKQGHLQMMGILSHLFFDGFKVFRLHRLHPDIPTKGEHICLKRKDVPLRRALSGRALTLPLLKTRRKKRVRKEWRRWRRRRRRKVVPGHLGARPPWSCQRTVSALDTS